MFTRSVSTVCLVTLALMFRPVGLPAASAPDQLPRHYTVQVLSVPAERELPFLATCETLRRKGYLVYHCRAVIDGRTYLRLRSGVFRSRAEADAYGRQLRDAEGFDYFVTETDGFVNYLDGRTFVFTTPSGIWLQSGDSARRLYSPADGHIDTDGTRARIAPDGSAIAFYEDQAILTLDIDSGDVRVLRQATSDRELLNSVVRWSPDSQYLAYLDVAEWELPTKLWLMRRDGRDRRRLVADPTGRTRVKSFLWHPRENGIFYVAGPTHGTVSVGGTLYSTDLAGRRTVIAAASPDQRKEVHSTFRIAGDTLHYRIAHFDGNGQVRHYTSHTLALTESRRPADRPGSDAR